MADRVNVLSELMDVGIIPDQEITLDITALRFSALDHPHRPLSSLYLLLDHMAREVCGMLRPRLSLARQALVLESVLCRQGFKCAQEPHIRSSDTVRAVETRRGVPMMLAILYVGAARRCGLDAAIMDIVSGVVIRLGSDRQNVFVGVGANGGFGVLDTDSDRTAYVISPYPPLSNRMTLVMLMDAEAMSSERNGDFVRANALYDRICTIAPRHPELWSKKAAIELRMKRYRSARMSLLSILELTRNKTIRNEALDALANIPD